MSNIIKLALLALTLSATTGCHGFAYGLMEGAGMWNPADYVTDESAPSRGGATYITPFANGYMISGPGGTSYAYPFGTGWAVYE